MDHIHYIERHVSIIRNPFIVFKALYKVIYSDESISYNDPMIPNITYCIDTMKVDMNGNCIGYIEYWRNKNTC